MAIEPRNPFEADEGPCVICGKSVDDCICPECPTCGAHGDPKCYRDNGHPLRLSMAQVIAHQEHKIAVMKESFADQIANQEEFLSRLREQKEVDMSDYAATLPPRGRR